MRERAESVDAELEVHSAPGKGTRINLTWQGRCKRVLMSDATDGADAHRIRVMIVDDHAMVRSGLSAFLLAFDDLELAAEASSGEQAVELPAASTQSTWCLWTS